MHYFWRFRHALGEFEQQHRVNQMPPTRTMQEILNATNRNNTSITIREIICHTIQTNRSELLHLFYQTRSSTHREINNEKQRPDTKIQDILENCHSSYIITFQNLKSKWLHQNLTSSKHIKKNELNLNFILNCERDVEKYRF